MWKLFYSLLLLAQISFCEWLHLKENIAPIQGFYSELISTQQNTTFYSYKSKIHQKMVFNITDINIGFKSILLILQLTISKQEIEIFNENGKDGSLINCNNLINMTSICQYEMVPVQQQYIYFELLSSGEIFQISNIQLMVNNCQRGCIECQNDICLVCENDLFFVKFGQKYCLQQTTLRNEDCQNFQHLGQKYESCLELNITKIYEIQNIEENQMVIDQTDQPLGKIQIDNKIFKGPYQQNDHFTIQLNKTLKGLNNIQIQFTLYILGELIPFKLVKVQINNYQNLFIKNYEKLSQNKCTSNFSKQCLAVQTIIPVENILNLSNLTIRNNYPLHQLDKGWTIGQIKLKTYKYLPCQFKTYYEYCVKECPIYTEEIQQNICIDVFKEKYLNLFEQKFVSITEYPKLDQTILNAPFFSYKSNYYFSFKNNYFLDTHVSNNISTLIIYFKLLFFNADNQSKIILSVQQHKREFLFQDLQKIDLIIGKDNIQLYYLNVDKEYFPLQDSDKFLNFKIQCVSTYKRTCAISQLFIFEINCPEFANKSNCGVLDTSQQNYNNNLCLDGYYYEDFSCNKCQDQNCIKCINQYNCIECKNDFVLYGNQCFYNLENRIYTNQLFYFDYFFFPNDGFPHYHSYCLNQSEIQNFMYCDCRAGYFFEPKIKGCSACNQTCYECSENENNCEKCDELSNRILETHTCVCKEGYYETENYQKCEKCSKNCKSCSYSPYVCSNCFIGQNRILIEQQCVCMKGYYLDIINDICLKCSSVCEKCRIDGKCVKCFENQNRYLTINNECICKDGFYEDEQFNCIACHYSCSSCDNSQEFNKCTECPSNRVKKNENLNHFECICEYGYYDDGSKDCQDCLQIKSTNPGDYCYSNCGDSIVQWNEDCDNGLQIIRNDCYRCKYSLSKCNPDFCLKCLKYECQQCYDGYYLDLDYSCKKCSIQCLTCTQNPDNCIECSKNSKKCLLCSQSKGYEYKQEECQPVCGDGFVVNQEECDDSNLIDNDGCDKKCKIEKGFQCYGNICLDRKEKLIIKENKLEKVYDSQRSFIVYVENLKNFNLNDIEFYLDQQILYFVEGVNFTILEQSNYQKGNLKFKIKLSLEESQENQYLIVNLIGSNSFAKIHVLPYFNKKDYKYFYLDNILLDLSVIIINIYFYLNFVSIIFIPDFRLSEIYSTLLQFSFLNYMNSILPYSLDKFIQEFKIFEIMRIVQNHQNNSNNNENLQELFYFKIQHYLNFYVQLNFMFYFLITFLGMYICKLILQILLQKYLNLRIILKKEFLFQDFQRFIWSRISYIQFQINMLLLFNLFLGHEIIIRLLNAIILYFFVKIILKDKIFKQNIQIILLFVDVLNILAQIFLSDQIVRISFLLSLLITNIVIQIYIKLPKIDFYNQLFLSVSLILNLIYIQIFQITVQNYSAKSFAGTIVILLSNLLLILGLFMMIYKILQLSMIQIQFIKSIFMRKEYKIQGYFQCKL